MEFNKRGDILVTKEFLKTEIDKIPDDYLELLYRIMKALEVPARVPTADDTVKSRKIPANGPFDWQQFIEETYGSLADAPIQRGDQGKFEKREIMK
ncbi:MAG: hypothetical protein ACE5HS_03070 [bacterium]